MNKRFSNKEKGQGLVEYAIILSVVAVAAISGMAYFGGVIKGKIASLSGAIAGDIKQVEKGEKASTGFSKKAEEASKKVTGMNIKTDGKDAEVIDESGF